MYFCPVCNETYEEIQKAMDCCTKLDKDWYSLQEVIKILDLDPKEIVDELEKED